MIELKKNLNRCGNTEYYLTALRFYMKSVQGENNEIFNEQLCNSIINKLDF